MAGHREKLQGEKTSIYKRVIYYFQTRWKIKYLTFFSLGNLFLICFLEFLTKISVKKLLNIISKIGNNIFNIFFTGIFVSPCVYKLIIYTYICIYI